MTVKISIPAGVLMGGSVGRQTIGSLGSSEDSTASGSLKNPSFNERHPKVVRSLTVVAYIFCVSLAAIILSAYYVVLWTPAGNDSQKNSNLNITSSSCRGITIGPDGEVIVPNQHYSQSRYTYSSHRRFYSPRISKIYRNRGKPNTNINNNSNNNYNNKPFKGGDAEYESESDSYNEVDNENGAEDVADPHFRRFQHDSPFVVESTRSSINFTQESSKKSKQNETDDEDDYDDDDDDTEESEPTTMAMTRTTPQPPNQITTTQAPQMRRKLRKMSRKEDVAIVKSTSHFPSVSMPEWETPNPSSSHHPRPTTTAITKATKSIMFQKLVEASKPTTENAPHRSDHR